MKWLKRKIRRWALNDDTIGGAIRSVDMDEYSSQKQQSRSRTLNASGMNFKLYSANGGYIVEVTSKPATLKNYNTPVEDEYNLHVITLDEDLGERIGQIVTIEVIRQ